MASNINVNIDTVKMTPNASAANSDDDNESSGMENVSKSPSTRSVSICEDEPNPMADFMSGDLMAKPFTHVTKTKKPFLKKKSGLLNVLAKKATKNRICTKKGFALIWYLLFWIHGDFDPERKQTPCVSDLKHYAPFTSSYLFSLETQHTIGYGFKATTEKCPSAIILMSLQSIAGVIISTITAGIIFAKFTMPRKRGQTVIFSKNAVITLRNGALYLICRVCDLRKSGLLEPHVRMVIIQNEVTEEGETIPYQQSDLKLTTEMDGKNDKICMSLPVTIAHKIDEKSPFYDMKPSELLKSNFEIIVSLLGVTEETGNSIQVKTSYVPNEIMWGHQFDHNTVEYDKNMGSYQVLHSRIHATITDDTPRLSARQLDARFKRKANFFTRNMK